MAKRRGNGEGSIRQRANDGRWEARLTLTNGKAKYLYGRTRAEAARKLAIAIRDRDMGLPSMGERQTVGQYLAAWLETIKPTVRPKTWIRYANQVNGHIVPAVGRVKLAKLSAQQVQLLYSGCLEAGLATGTVGHLHGVFHRAMKDAMRLGLIPRNPCDLVTPPRKQRKEMHVYTPEQAQRFLAAVAGDRLEALYVLALTTGMRQGELLGLKWADVDLDGAALYVRHTLHHQRGNTWYLGTPKTSKSRRKIELTRMAVDALRKHRARQAAERLALGGEVWTDHDFVFTRGDGEPLRGTDFSHFVYKPLLKRAGLPPLRFHDLRHTAATLLLLQGVNPKVVSEMLGHATVSMTLDIYSHVLPSMQRDAASAMERALMAR